MPDIEVLSIGIQGPPGPGSVSPGAVIATRGAIIVGNASAVPVPLLIGSNGQYLRANGSDLLYSVILEGDLPFSINAAKLANGTISNTQLQYVSGVTSSIQPQIDAKSASTHGHLTNISRGIFIDQQSQSTATPTDNTSSTSTNASAMEYDFTLPTGTWTVHAIGGVALRHSTGGEVYMRASIDGQDTTGRVYSVTSTTLYAQVIDDDVKSGCTGIIRMKIQFKSVDAGTTYAKNSWAFIVAERSA